MDSVEQLKKIREDAISRLRGSEDYKLIGKLGDLISELGGNLTPFPATGTTKKAIGPQSTGPDITPKPNPHDMAVPSTVSASLAAIRLDDTINELLDDNTEKGAEEAADEIVDELVAELETEGLQDVENPAVDTDSKTELQPSGSSEESAPTVSIFKSAQNRFANGSSKQH